MVTLIVKSVVTQNEKLQDVPGFYIFFVMPTLRNIKNVILHPSTLFHFDELLI